MAQSKKPRTPRPTVASLSKEVDELREEVKKLKIQIQDSENNKNESDQVNTTNQEVPSQEVPSQEVSSQEVSSQEVPVDESNNDNASDNISYWKRKATPEQTFGIILGAMLFILLVASLSYAKYQHDNNEKIKNYCAQDMRSVNNNSRNSHYNNGIPLYENPYENPYENKEHPGEEVLPNEIVPTPTGATGISSETGGGKYHDHKHE